MIPDNEKLAERCFWSAIVIVVSITVLFWGSWLIVGIAWLLAYPLALLFGLIIGFVGAMLGWETGEAEEIRIYASEVEDIIAERSATVIGKFQDADIHEWVIMKRPDNGELVRCEFEYTMDMCSSNFTPPDNVWFCVMPPGIFYVAKPENIAIACTAT